MRHRLSIDTSILERYPTYSLLIIYAEGLTNGPSDAESCALLRAAEQQCRATLAQEMLTMQPHIAAWRDAYRSFGAKPKKYPCSLEALLARVLKRQELPQINRLVDMYNAISLKYLLPTGGEDWDRISSELRYPVESLRAAGEDLMQQMARVCPGATMTVELLGMKD